MVVVVVTAARDINTHGIDGSAVGVGVPGLFMHLQGSLWRQHSDERGHFPVRGGMYS